MFSVDFDKVYEVAYSAGMEAVRKNPSTNWFPCGFAWVNVPGNSAFGRWLKKSGKGSKGYPKGVNIWIGAHGQSYNDKMTHATAMAQSIATQLQMTEVYASGRLD